ncbi:hypothetical protein GCM10010517_40530 [Streptosporangium fragile]|uniref:Transcriptional regulator n=1 Tax=Streptosporangium fragile TaxID=46186 RepID=A0ABP6IJK6_9ACTN
MPSVEIILNGLAADHATGSLSLGKAGILYLTGGRVTYAESATAPRVEDLLTAGRGIPAHTVRQARQATTEETPGGELLVRQGALTRGELEFCVLSAVLDAAFFLFGSAGHRPRFRPGERHWLGPQWYFEVTGLLRECRRRETRLEQAWPSAELDTSPVVPLRRITAQRVVLTSLQWEVLVCADSSATPVDLARRLGRPAYSVLLAVRQLASCGLLRVPRPAPESGAEPAPDDPDDLGAPDGRANPAPDDPGTSDGRAEPAPDRPDGRGAARATTVPPATPAGPAPAASAVADPLPRRTRGATEFPDAGTGSPVRTDRFPRATGDPTDVNLLIRLRNALEALT